MDSELISKRVREVASQLSEELAAIEGELRTTDAAAAGYVRLVTAIDSCLDRLRELNLWGTENRLPSSELWNAAGQWLAQGWLQNHARTKPRGYAGDHEMLARIFDNRLCDDSLGRLFDRYFQAQAAPQAVRNRMRMMAKWIGELARQNAAIGSVKIAMVGSAFGLELREALLGTDENTRQRVQATLLDLDPAALEFARQELAPLLTPDQLSLSNTNLFRLPERPKVAAQLVGTHLLLCPGLFDYLDDEAAAKMLRCLAGQLAPGGRLIVFQFAPHNPTRAYMEWFANWYLIYRDEAALRRVTESAGIGGAEFTYGAEELGVDLYVQITLTA